MAVEKGLYSAPLGMSEDITDMYPSRTEPYTGKFIVIPNLPVTLREKLISETPAELINTPTQVFGCPDCADQGGYYIDIAPKEGAKKFWIIDTNKSAVPEYLHDYSDLIIEVIQEINE